MSHAPPQAPLIAIVGATGTGKSHLAVALAKRFHGEIINGDALQMYKGLPIATNKIPREEMQGIPHHLLGCVGLEEEPWNVGKFAAESKRLIDEIRARRRIPILVGGTHYYTQSLICRKSVLEKTTDYLSPEELEEKWPILRARAEEMLDELRKVDPEMAQRWHPKDSRKIRRSLEIWLQTGRKASTIYEEQRLERLASAQPAALWGFDQVEKGLLVPEVRYQGGRSALCFDTLVFWVHADSSVLKMRLDGRVDRMVVEGLLTEVESMRSLNRQLSSGGKDIDTNRGIWVAIGYKEFEDYLSACKGGAERNRLEMLKADGLEKTKAATRQYAKRQVRWIRLKLLPALRDAGSANQLFLLDGTQLPNWSTNVEELACSLTESYVAGMPLPSPATTSEIAMSTLGVKSANVQAHGSVHTRVCEICGTTMMTAKEWEEHTR
ncbi:MAG: hypothetical protein Q9187_001721, partial [Circinaria calcarea]